MSKDLSGYPPNELPPEILTFDPNCRSARKPRTPEIARQPGLRPLRVTRATFRRGRPGKQRATGDRTRGEVIILSEVREARRCGAASLLPSRVDVMLKGPRPLEEKE